MQRARAVLWRTCRAFYDDQMTHHAAALTYYGLLCLFPSVLLGISLLGLLGEYPRTYDAVIDYLRDVAPADTVDAFDGSLKSAVRDKGTAATALVIALATTLYGTTGALEATRRALNVVFEVEGGRGFLHRKAIDIGSTTVLFVLVLAAVVLVFVGGSLAEEVFALLGLGEGASHAWSLARWPAAVVIAMLAFAWVYYVTPDVEDRAFRWITPGAAVGVLLWLLASYGFSSYVSNFSSVNALYGAFTAAIVLVFWLWLTAVALLFGAELDAEIGRGAPAPRAAPARP